jgi:hypothetical protein
MSGSSSSPTLSVNNVLSFNGHGGKITGSSFTLPENVYVLVPFGIGVEGAKDSSGSTKKTDGSFKGLDVCYGFPDPEDTQSFEEIIYGDPGKLKLTFGSDVDATWHLYKPHDVVPNINYFPWKDADKAGVSCGDVSSNYDAFVSDLMKHCLGSSDILNNSVCALFVSDSTKTDTTADYGKRSGVFIDKYKNYHLKLKICGDNPNVVTTTLEELANNCHKLVEFSREFVKTKKKSGETYDGYDDANIFPKSGTDDPIILLPFSCNSCDSGKDIAIDHTNAGDASAEPLSKIIGELSGGGGGSASPPPPSGKVAQFFMTYKPKDAKKEDVGLYSGQQAQKIVNVVKCLIAKGYKHIGLTYSANQAQTNEILTGYRKTESDIFSSNDEKEISKTTFNGAANQGSVLNNLSNLVTDTDFNKAFRIIPFTTMKKSGGDLDDGAPGNVDDCINAAKQFLKLDDSIILGWCNQDCAEMTNKTSSKQKFAIGGGVATGLDDATKIHIPRYLNFLDSEWDQKFQEIVNECNPDPKSVDAPASSTPPAKSAPSKPKVALADVLKGLEDKLTLEGDSSADISKLSIKDPGLFYPTTESDTIKKKNLNSAGPTIDVMIKGFESAETGDDTNFYLGACRSIQAAYDLEKGDKTEDSDEGMRAKLLLNLRKNSLLLKVPERWDYKEMKMKKLPPPPTDLTGLMTYSLQDTIEYYSQDGGATEDEKKRFDELKIVKEPTYASVGSATISGVDGRFVKGIDAEMAQACFFVATLQLLFCDEDFLQLIIFLSCQSDDYINSINSNNGDGCNTKYILKLDNNVKSPFETQPDPGEKTDVERGKDILKHLVKLFKAYIIGQTINNEIMKNIYDALGLRYARQQDSGEVITRITSYLGCLKNIYVEKYFSNNFLELKETITYPKHADFRNKDNIITPTELRDKLIMTKIPAPTPVSLSVQTLVDSYLDEEQDYEFTNDDIQANNIRQKIIENNLTSIPEANMKKTFCEMCQDFLKYSQDKSKEKLLASIFEGYDKKSVKYVTSGSRKQSELEITLGAIQSAIETNTSDEEICRTIVEDIKYVILNPMVKEINSSTYKNLKKISKKSVSKYSEYIFININRTLEGGKKNLIDIDISKTLDINSLVYTLVGYVYHEGDSSTSGHFVCVKCGSDGEPKVQISDSSVTEWTKKYSKSVAWGTGVFLLIYKKKQSQAGGGFKPRHNPITNNAASKSKHNSSFKISSSSKSKGKSRNRSHTQRVK